MTEPDERLSTFARHVLQLAVDEMERAGRKAVMTEDLLFALLREPGSLAGGLLQRFGLHEADVRERREFFLRTAPVTPARVRGRATPEFRRVVEVATAEARAAGVDTLGTQHLLLGLLLQNGGIGVAMLGGSDEIDFVALLAETREVAGTSEGA